MVQFVLCEFLQKGEKKTCPYCKSEIALDALTVCVSKVFLAANLFCRIDYCFEQRPLLQNLLETFIQMISGF